ncbi:hypothetical protein FRB99_002327, partial [Tulasnella sp. 403]
MTLARSSAGAELDPQAHHAEPINVDGTHQNGSDHSKVSPLTYAGRIVRECTQSFGFGPFFCVIGKLVTGLKSRVARVRDAIARRNGRPRNDPESNSIVMTVTARNMRIRGITQCDNGGSAIIYRGKHRKFGEVALKYMRPNGDCSTRFDLEVKAWQCLDHPGILRFLGIHRKDDRLFMVSPWMRNGRILDYLKTRPDVNRILFLMEISEALAYIHDKGMIHGDVKSANILVSDSGHALVCDLGLSRACSTVTNVVLKGDGTPSYQSPELFNGDPKTVKSDVYAFGITTYE